MEAKQNARHRKQMTIKIKQAVGNDNPEYKMHYKNLKQCQTLSKKLNTRLATRIGKMIVAEHWEKLNK